MKMFSKILLVVFFALSPWSPAWAATAVNLGTAGNFAVLGGTTVTNTGSTVVNGDLGLSPGTSVTGFPPGTVNGTQHITDAIAAQAQADLVTAYNSAAAQSGGVTVSGDLGGQTLAPGVYNSASSLGLTGTLTLDGQGNSNSVFIFQAGSTLTTASASRVNLINGAQACNVFWQVGSSTTLGTNSNFVGNILTLSSVTATTGAVVNGRVLARNGAVTLDTNSISKPVCAAAVVIPSPTPAPTPTTTPTSTLVTVTPPPVTSSTTPLVATPMPPAVTPPPAAMQPFLQVPPAPPSAVVLAQATSLPVTGLSPNPLIVILSLLVLVILFVKRTTIFSSKHASKNG